MPVRFDSRKNVFLLETPSSTYVIRLFGKRVLHGGWFHRLPGWSDACVTPSSERPSFSPVPEDFEGKAYFSPDVCQQEFPVTGRGDFRAPAVEAVDSTGANGTEFLYVSHDISRGKKKIPGLPATYADEDDAATLEIELADPSGPLRLTLSYTVWEHYDAICRHARIRNASDKESVSLRAVMSASMDFPHYRFRMLQLSGAHTRERRMISRALCPGMQSVESRRGMSSHQQNPFMALMGEGATESSGEVFGFSLVYSGNFIARAEVDQFGICRAQIGINPYNFGWKLEPGGEFCTPEAVLVRSEEGLGGMSRTYHELYQRHLCRGEWRDKLRPIVINNWEATYFDFNAEKLFALADTAASCGMELFVLDDGWFGKRNDDHSSLGDWFVNKEKLPDGLRHIADGIHSRGMKFGLWFEPEMISPDSDLYRAHPDWCLHVGDRKPALGRHQLVLDMSRKDVRDYLEKTISSIILESGLDYIKWDFNRCPSDVASASLPADKQLEVSHRFYLGLYELLERLVTKFPHVLFESCSGGGGRFDPGMLHYMPQTWTSDNTDALSRIAIQLGTSVVYPPSAMSCHVSASPNHQIGRMTTLSMRGDVAMAGTFGYELDLNKLSSSEIEEIKSQVDLYKSIRDVVQFGSFYRLETPLSAGSTESSSYGAWQYVSRDKKRSVITVAWSYAEANAEYLLIKPQGLEEGAAYAIHCPPGRIPPLPEGTEVSGGELMYCGLRLTNQPGYGGSLMLLLEKA
ncbi:MAG: alpha-galactosidase [Treponema sp.]|nr:alpha-galactosidase [Treponema sp.]